MDNRNTECLGAIVPVDEPATEYLAEDVWEGAANASLLESTGLQKLVCVQMCICIFVLAVPSLHALSVFKMHFTSCVALCLGTSILASSFR